MALPPLVVLVLLPGRQVPCPVVPLQLPDLRGEEVQRVELVDGLVGAHRTAPTGALGA